MLPVHCVARLVEELIYLSGGLRINSRDLGEIGQACPLDGFHSAKMPKQRTLSRRPDPRNFLQSGLANVFFAARAMRADSEAVRFVPQPLDEIKYRVARRQPKRVAAGHEKCLPTGVAIRPLGNRNQGNIGDAERGQCLLRSVELALTAIDQHQVGPRRILVIGAQLPYAGFLRSDV